MTELALVYATFPDMASAQRTARALVDAHLVACCNLLNGMQAVYGWDGAVQETIETVLLAKTTPGMAASVVEAIGRDHPYENPAILHWPITGGAADYLAWVSAHVLPSPPVR